MRRAGSPHSQSRPRRAPLLAALLQLRDLETSARFVERQRRPLLLLAALFVGLAVLTIALRRRIRLRLAGDPSLSNVQAVFDRPISLALLLTILLAEWIFPSIPRPLAPALLALLLLPAVRILRRLLDRSLFPLLYALVFFYFFDQVRELVAPLPNAPRLLRVIELSLLVLLMLWWLRPPHIGSARHQLARQRLLRVVRFGVRVALAGGALALAAEVTGYSRLSGLAGGAVLLGAYAAVILYGGLRVLDGIVALLLRVRPLRLLGMVQRCRQPIRERITRVLGWGAAVWWAYATLGRAELWTPAWDTGTAILTASLRVGELSVSLGDVVLFFFTLWASFQVSRFVRFALEEDVYPRSNLKKGMPYAFSALTHYGLLLIGFFVALSALGVDLDRFSLILGAFSVGIGFGLQTIVNNFVSGLILLTERPVEVGDTVVLADVFGEVERIGIRSSTVRTWQGAEVIVPNAELVSQQVTNWTHSDRRRRIEIEIGVAYGSDPGRVMQLMLDVARAHPDVMEEPEPVVLFKDYADSAMRFEVRTWTSEFNRGLITRSALLVELDRALKEAGIRIPFPQRDVHLRPEPAAGDDGG